MSTYEVFEAADGWRWRLRAANGEIVAASESYTSKRDAKRGVESARKASEKAPPAERDEAPE